MGLEERLCYRRELSLFASTYMEVSTFALAFVPRHDVLSYHRLNMVNLKDHDPKPRKQESKPFLIKGRLFEYFSLVSES